jgi:predicted transcriptional regulator
MAAAYAKKTRKTMVRDVNKLINMGLMERTKDGIRAKREIILAFLPARKFS